MSQYKAIIQRSGEWWIGWIEELPGVNCQGATRDELLENLRSALAEMIEMNAPRPAPPPPARSKKQPSPYETPRSARPLD